MTNLTPREVQVMRIYATGTAKHVARELNISASTVEKHLANIKEKLNVGSLREAVYIFGMQDAPSDTCKVMAFKSPIFGVSFKYE